MTTIILDGKTYKSDNIARVLQEIPKKRAAIILLDTLMPPNANQNVRSGE